MPRKTTTTNRKNSDRPEANGFLNLYVVDKAGNRHRIKAVVGLYDDNAVHKALLGKAGDELVIVGQVNLNVKSDVVIEL